MEFRPLPIHIEKFWRKLTLAAVKAGCPLVCASLKLFYGYRDVSRRYKWMIASVLAYFVSPIDLIPDLLPGGLLDDFALIFVVLKRISRWLSPLTKARAQEKATRFLGENCHCQDC